MPSATRPSCASLRGTRAAAPALRYVPIDVNVLFGEPTVALRGPWGNDLVEIAPKAKDLGRGLWGYHLDFPGNALQPGCDYLHWQQHLGRRADADRVRARRDRPGAPGRARAPVLVLLRLQRLEQPARRRLGDDPARLRRPDGRGRAADVAGRGRVQPARGRGAGRLGRPEARARRRHAPGRPPGRRLARELLRGGAVSRQLRLGGRRLRRHSRADRRRATRRS